jgi:hypothetical protein
MTIDRMRSEIKLRWNKLNSNHKTDFPNAYLDDIINDAISEYVEIFYSGNNSKKYKIGFEVTQQRIDMLSTLVSSKLFTANKIFDNVYIVNIGNPLHKYRHFLRGSFGICDKNIIIDVIRHNDFDYKMKDENIKPSLKWGRAIGLFKRAVLETDLYIYTDYNDTDTLSVSIDYLRNPAKVFSSGYDSIEYLNGDTTAYKTADPKVNCDLPETYHTLIVDIAVQLIAGILEDNNKFAISEDKILKIT